MARVSMARGALAALGLSLGLLVAPSAFAEGRGVREMYGVVWQPTLDHAVLAANPAKGAVKPIACFRVLGDLDGLT